MKVFGMQVVGWWRLRVPETASLHAVTKRVVGRWSILFGEGLYFLRAFREGIWIYPLKTKTSSRNHCYLVRTPIFNWHLATSTFWCGIGKIRIQKHKVMDLYIVAADCNYHPTRTQVYLSCQYSCVSPDMKCASRHKMSEPVFGTKSRTHLIHRTNTVIWSNHEYSRMKHNPNEILIF